MKCPKCGTEVFDLYTTEQRIKDLYNANLTLGWVQNRIRIFAESLEDRLISGSTLRPISQAWLAKELREIHDKIKVVS